MHSGDDYVSPQFKYIETEITYVSIVWGKSINIFTQSIIYQHKIDKALIQYKMSSYQHGKSHCGDKTILRPSYRHNRISFTDRALFVYWIGPLVAEILPIWKHLTFYLTAAMAVMTQWRNQAHCWQFCGNILVSTQHGSVRIYHHAFITHTWHTSRDFFLLIFHFRLPLINDLALTFVSARKYDFDRFNATVMNFEMSKTQHKAYFARILQYTIKQLVQSPVSISDKTPYREISQSLEGARSYVKMFVSLWNLTSSSAAVLLLCQSNFRAIGRFKSRGFKTLRHLIIIRLIIYWNRAQVFDFESNFLLHDSIWRLSFLLIYCLLVSF